MQFQKATKKAAKLRLALVGPAGSGKTYSALAVAAALGGRIAVIDTERGSASKYSDLFDFDTLEMDVFSPLHYVEAIRAAARAGYDVLIIDSLSHAWVGKGGALEMHDVAVARQKSTNTFAAWRDVTPHHNAMVEAIIQAPLHLIATMRAKTEYVVEDGGKKVRKVGLAPVQRDGLEYEFDVVGDIDMDHRLIISKTRCPALSGAVLFRPGADLARTLMGWLGGSPAPQQPQGPPVNGNAQKPQETVGQMIVRLDAWVVSEGYATAGELTDHMREVFSEQPADLAAWASTDTMRLDVTQEVRRFVDGARRARAAKAMAGRGG